ncbi:Hypothetical protein PHPALM_14471 [Phytophthora palmivora]|uniref:Uncharacterized protein n=1 Tax=Phytophthora palmivora TaxID=4796 RepID=A0A2P4XUV8_9STRA|nr:Hypothetical protein PHPALM_14471 [Phytophthora palmivora]
MRMLHVELLNVTKETMRSILNIDDLTTEPTTPGDHRLVKLDDIFESSYCYTTYTENHEDYVPLCRRICRNETGSTLTSSQMWHQIWVNCTAIPAHLRKHIRFYLRKRRCRNMHTEAKNEDNVDNVNSK